MIRLLKKILIEFLLKINRSQWTNNNGFKVLIKTNKSFNRSVWEKKILDSIPNKKHTEIIYTGSTISFFKLFTDADVCFSYGLSSNLRLSNKKAKLLYFATVGNEFLKNRIIPEIYQIKNPAGIASNAIAEYVITMSMVLNRNLFTTFANQTKQFWNQEQALNKPFRPFNQLIIGVLGLGNNGKAIVKKFKEMGCIVFGCDLIADEEIQLDKWYHTEQLTQMLSEINMAIICVPFTKETRGLIDIKKLEAIGSNGYLINVSRGEIVKEKDLINALHNKTIAGAAIDVCQREPLPYGNKLWKTPNLIITPHIAGNINLFVSEIMDDFIEKASRFFKKNV